MRFQTKNFPVWCRYTIMKEVPSAFVFSEGKGRDRAEREASLFVEGRRISVTGYMEVCICRGYEAPGGSCTLSVRSVGCLSLAGRERRTESFRLAITSCCSAQRTSQVKHGLLSSEDRQHRDVLQTTDQPWRGSCSPFLLVTILPSHSTGYFRILLPFRSSFFFLF